jgi:hypothetical protein
MPSYFDRSFPEASPPIRVAGNKRGPCHYTPSFILAVSFNHSDKAPFGHYSQIRRMGRSSCPYRSDGAWANQGFD